MTDLQVQGKYSGMSWLTTRYPVSLYRPVGGTLNRRSGAHRKNRWPRGHSYSRPTKTRNTMSTTSATNTQPVSAERRCTTGLQLPTFRPYQQSSHQSALAADPSTNTGQDHCTRFCMALHSSTWGHSPDFPTCQVNTYSNLLLPIISLFLPSFKLSTIKSVA